MKTKNQLSEKLQILAQKRAEEEFSDPSEMLLHAHLSRQTIRFQFVLFVFYFLPLALCILGFMFPGFYFLPWGVGLLCLLFLAHLAGSCFFYLRNTSFIGADEDIAFSWNRIQRLLLVLACWRSCLLALVLVGYAMSSNKGYFLTEAGAIVLLAAVGIAFTEAIFAPLSFFSLLYHHNKIWEKTGRGGISATFAPL